jgi:hypothetical protein
MTIQTRSMTSIDSMINSKTDSKTKKEKQKEIKKRKKQFTRDRKTDRLQKVMKYTDVQADEQADVLADEQDEVQLPIEDRFRIVPKCIAYQRVQIAYHICGISILFEIEWDGENVLLSHNHSDNTCLFHDMTLRRLIHYSFQDVIIPEDCPELDSLISVVPLCQIDIYAAI